MDDETNTECWGSLSVLGLDAADRSAFHEGMIASGTRTTEEDIDEELYG